MTTRIWTLLVHVSDQALLALQVFDHVTNQIQVPTSFLKCYLFLKYYKAQKALRQ